MQTWRSIPTTIPEEVMALSTPPKSLTTKQVVVTQPTQVSSENKLESNHKAGKKQCKSVTI